MVQSGMTHTLTIEVKPEMTAASLKSGALDVFATPLMIANMENVCFECVENVLDEGMSTVGTAVNVTHLAPTPVGMKVRFECTLREVDRRRLVFEVKAYDEISLIGEGIHERFIVDSAKFVEKSLARTARG